MEGKVNHTNGFGTSEDCMCTCEAIFRACGALGSPHRNARGCRHERTLVGMERACKEPFPRIRVLRGVCGSSRTRLVMCDDRVPREPAPTRLSNSVVLFLHPGFHIDSVDDKNRFVLNLVVKDGFDKDAPIQNFSQTHLHLEVQIHDR